MDKNTLTGFILIAAVLIGFSYFSRPSEAEMEAQRRQDSIATVAQQKAQMAQEAKEKAEKLKCQNDKLNAVLDLEIPSALTKEECELLIQYLLAENNVVLEEYRICYMRGLMDGMEIKKTVE